MHGGISIQIPCGYSSSLSAGPWGCLVLRTPSPDLADSRLCARTLLPVPSQGSRLLSTIAGACGKGAGPYEPARGGAVLSSDLYSALVDSCRTKALEGSKVPLRCGGLLE